MDFRDKLKYDLIRFLTIAGDLMALNALWLVCSIPIITIGPSTCALYKVCLKLAKDGSCPVLKTFFSAFKESFKQSLIIGAFSIFVIITLYSDVNYILAVEGTIQKIFIVVAIIVTAMLLIVITYGNGLIANYENSLKNHIINAFKLAFVNPIETILIWIIILLPFGLAYLFFVNELVADVILYLGWFIIMYLASLPVYLISRILTKVFTKIEKRK